MSTYYSPPSVCDMWLQSPVTQSLPVHGDLRVKNNVSEIFGTKKNASVLWHSWTFIRHLPFIRQEQQQKYINLFIPLCSSILIMGYS